MQLVDCTVAIGGDVRMIVAMKGITVAELTVLQEIHDRGSVENVEVVGELRNFNATAHRDRLRETYDRPGDAQSRVLQLFPGVLPQMPTKLSDVVLVDPEANVAASDQSEGEPVRFDQTRAPDAEEVDAEDEDKWEEDPAPEGVSTPEEEDAPANEAVNPFEA